MPDPPTVMVVRMLHVLPSVQVSVALVFICCAVLHLVLLARFVRGPVMVSSIFYVVKDVGRAGSWVLGW